MKKMFNKMSNTVKTMICKAHCAMTCARAHLSAPLCNIFRSIGEPIQNHAKASDPKTKKPCCDQQNEGFYRLYHHGAFFPLIGNGAFDCSAHHRQNCRNEQHSRHHNSRRQHPRTKGAAKPSQAFIEQRNAQENGSRCHGQYHCCFPCLAHFSCSLNEGDKIREDPRRSPIV